MEPASPCTSCISRWVLYHCTTWEAPYALATQSQFLHPISGVHMPLVLFMGLPGVVVSGSTLTWLESGSGGEWVRWKMERMKLDFEEPRPGLGTKGVFRVALPLLPSLPTGALLHVHSLTCPGSRSWPGSGCWSCHDWFVFLSGVPSGRASLNSGTQVYEIRIGPSGLPWATFNQLILVSTSGCCVTPAPLGLPPPGSPHRHHSRLPSPPSTCSSLLPWGRVLSITVKHWSSPVLPLYTFPTYNLLESVEIFTCICWYAFL